MPGKRVELSRRSSADPQAEGFPDRNDRQDYAQPRRSNLLHQLRNPRHIWGIRGVPTGYRTDPAYRLGVRSRLAAAMAAGVLIRVGVAPSVDGLRAPAYNCRL